ncbi:MAG: hypothetical protein ACRD3C_05425 [Vicinamibacterales bacterium]
MRTPPHVTIGMLLAVAALTTTAGAALRAQNVSTATPGSAAQGPSNGAGTDIAGATLFKTYCAICPEGPGANPQAPSREVMGRMSAEQVLDALERGSMRARAAERSRAQRHALATYVSGKPLASDAGGPLAKAALCTATSPLSPNLLAGPAWNGWGLGILNTRFQPPQHAGMSADDLPRLRLKWAFGFPGATSAGTQPVVAGGRVCGILPGNVLLAFSPE